MNSTQFPYNQDQDSAPGDLNRLSEQALGTLVRRALDESCTQMPAEISARLVAARHQALSRKKAMAPAWVMQTAGASGKTQGGLESWLGSWLGKLGWALPVLVLACSLLVFQEWHDVDANDDVADIDTAVLSDELPIDAYMDNGFTDFLNSSDDDTSSDVSSSPIHSDNSGL